MVRALRETVRRECCRRPRVAAHAVQRSTRERFPCSAKGSIRRASFLWGFRHPSLTKSGTCGTKATASCFSVSASCRSFEQCPLCVLPAHASASRVKESSTSKNNKQQWAGRFVVAVGAQWPSHHPFWAGMCLGVVGLLWEWPFSRPFGEAEC